MVDIEKCRKIISDACKGKWRMCVPPDENNDSDLVLSNAIDELERYQLPFCPYRGFDYCEYSKTVININKDCPECVFYKG